MSKRRRENQAPPTDWETERTLEAAEAEQSFDVPAHGGDAGETACMCGSRDLLLQAYYAVTDGRIASEPLEVEGLTCPQCSREYEAVQLEDGRVVRGELVGFADLDDEDD
ncbi:MAG: hypothetical protein JST54_09040 [Deltaproteobacteria bacterium]|nr:hypothetical protein [Deltaproteobacteria bacterium]